MWQDNGQNCHARPPSARKMSAAMTSRATKCTVHPPTPHRQAQSPATPYVNSIPIRGKVVKG